MQLSIRSAGGGTLEPFLTHLFKGGLIFESILKRFYANAGNTLGTYLQAGTPDLHLESALYTRQGRYLFNQLPNLLKAWQGEPFHERAVAVAYAVRNTSGHDLGWQDVLKDPSLYMQLFEEITDAIFWVIQQKYR
jgi:hypothetical protein